MKRIVQRFSGKKLLSLSVILILLIAGCLQACQAGPGKPGPGTEGITGKGETATMMPSFSMYNGKGQPVQLADFKGKKVFVNLWASWCLPCKREMPTIERLKQSVDSNKVVFVLLSLDDDASKAREYVSQQRFNLPVYFPAEKLPGIFNVEGIPATFIFDEKGSLIHHRDGGADYDTPQYRDLLN